MMEECILGGSKHADRVDTDMLVESFILGIYQCLEEIGCYLIIFYRSTVFVEILADEFSISRIDFRGLRGLWIQNA